MQLDGYDMNSIDRDDRLVAPREGARIVGVKSLTTFYDMVRRGDLPPLIKRGRYSFHLQSELQAYVHALAAESRRKF